MDLFKTISEILSENCDTIIVVRKNANGQMAVSTSFKNNDVQDQAKNAIPPFVVTGSAEELDNEFTDLIREPLEISSGLQTSMKQFEASAKAAKAKSAAASEEKKKTDEAAKAAKEHFDKLLKSAKEAEGKKNFSAAKKLYNEALAATENNALKSQAKAGIERCEKAEVPDMFGFGEEPEESTATETAQESAPEEPLTQEEIDNAEQALGVSDESAREETDELPVNDDKNPGQAPSGSGANPLDFDD